MVETLRRRAGASSGDREPDQTIRDIRNFIFGLRPQLIDGIELVEGLAALADEFRVNTMVDVELRAGPDVDGCR